MRVILKLYATLADYLPVDDRPLNRQQLQVSEGISVGQIIQQQHIPRDKVHMVLRNGVFLLPEVWMTEPVCDGDVLALWPPIAGG